MQDGFFLKMKIALVSEQVSKEGGVSRYVAELAEHFSKTDEVHIFSKKIGVLDKRRLEVHLINCITLPRMNLPHLLTLVQFILKSTFKTRAAGFDVINSQAVSHLNSDVVTAQSCHKAYFNEVERRNGLKSVLDPFHRVIILLEWCVYRRRRYKKIIAISNRVRGEIARYYGVPFGDIAVIPSGVNTIDFVPSLSVRRAMRKRLGISKKEVVFIFVAHEFKRKGLDTILHALTKVSGILVVVGRDSSKPYLQSISELGLSGRVVFAGTSLRVQDYYRMADIFVFPTRYEPFGLVITEALASGIPAITSRIAGAAELMQDGREGLLLEDPSDPEELAKKMELLGEDAVLRKKMGANGRMTALKYSWARVVRETRTVFEEVALKKV